MPMTPMHDRALQHSGAAATTRALLVPSWIRDYQRGWLRLDVIAGVTSAAIVIPQAMAYATIADLPVEVGLYTAFLPMLVYAWLGTSRPLSVSTTATLAILTGEELSKVAPQGDAAHLLAIVPTLSLLVGTVLVVAALLRLGFIANFISEPVLTGFKAGIAVVIVLKQLPKLLGIDVAGGSFLHSVAALWSGLPGTSAVTLAVGALTIAALAAMRRFWPGLPAPLVAVAAGIMATRWFALPLHGVATIGHIPTGLPHLALPDLSLVADLWPGAVAIALMSFTETAAAGRAFAAAEEPAPLMNRELLATGLANAAGSLVAAMPSGGGTTQTTVNRAAGARSQLAEIVTAVVTLSAMLLLARLIGDIPQATLAAVVTISALGLIHRTEFRAIRQIRRTEFVWALTAMAGVVLLGTLQGIVVAICVSLLALAFQESDPPVYALGRKPGTNVFRKVSATHPQDEKFHGLLLLRTEGRLFFANAEHITRKAAALVEASDPRVVILDLSAVFDVEFTALKMLATIEEKMRANGRVLCVSGLNPGVLDLVRRSALGEALGRERMFADLEEAVAKHRGQDVTGDR